MLWLEMTDILCLLAAVLPHQMCLTYWSSFLGDFTKLKEENSTDEKYLGFRVDIMLTKYC